MIRKTVLILAAFLLFVGFGFSQTVTPVSITVTLTETNAIVPVRLNSQASLPVSTMQFDITIPASGLTFVSANDGANTTAGKSLSSNVIVGTPSKLRVIILGSGSASQTAINSGEIAKLTFKGTQGTYILPVTGIVCASPAGANVPATGIDGSATLP